MTHPNAAKTHGAVSGGGGIPPRNAVAQTPPCGTPRNHAEEIANALAEFTRRNAMKEAARVTFELETG